MLGLVTALRCCGISSRCALLIFSSRLPCSTTCSCLLTSLSLPCYGCDIIVPTGRPFISTHKYPRKLKPPPHMKKRDSKSISSNAWQGARIFSPSKASSPCPAYINHICKVDFFPQPQYANVVWLLRCATTGPFLHTSHHNEVHFQPRPQTTTANDIRWHH